MSLAFHDVTLRWPDGDVVLDDFSATIPDGRSGLVGANGSGKSTLLRLLARDLTPAEGTVSAPGHVAWLRQDLVLRGDERVDAHLGVAGVRRALA
jgi:ATPase subunit of ABC transporter with duplicated ATPase domains